jgi:hypothetical protein
MAEIGPHPGFERVPNRHRTVVIESYCLNCGLFIAASSVAYTLDVAESAHECVTKLKFFQPRQ